jgi:adenylate kinase
LGKRVKEYMEKGLLVPDDIVIALILRRLASLDKDRGFVLDGFPRTLEQAKSLDKALAEENRLLDGVVYISVSTDELVRRLSGRRTCKRCQSPYNIWTSPPKVEGKCDHCGGELYQRPDDHEEAVRKRLEVFLNHTAPLLDYYNDKGNLIKVNGEQGVMEVAQEIKKALWG